MSDTLPLQWEVLRRSVNDEAPLLGTIGFRDPDSLCEGFDGLGYDGSGTCMSDGHYLCIECSALAPYAYRFTEYGRAGRVDRLLAQWATSRYRAAQAQAPKPPGSSSGG